MSYSSHLFRAAREDLRVWLRRQPAHGGVLGAAVFFGAVLLAWLVREGEMGPMALLFCGLAALVLFGVGVFAMHWGYLTPKRLCAAKQHQLESERHQFMVALDREKQAVQLIQAEREVLKAKLDERPLRPMELREEIDQLIAEGDALLDSVEATLLGESELWFDDVDRFAKRHLSPSQYDRLYAVTPMDVEEQVKFHRAASEDTPIADEEFAIAERLVRVSAGLRELRQSIGRKSAKAA
ncbi:MAG TPA: hypothetical protein VK961_27825 [Chthoniobacter sp.]|nr:hypothetical protein [Chthoniobacter sp.]